MDLRPLYIFKCLSAGIDFRRQSLKLAERVNHVNNADMDLINVSCLISVAEWKELIS